MTRITADWTARTSTDSRLLDVHAYWLTLGNRGSVPLRQNFSPKAIPRLLPFVILIDVVKEPRDFRFRVVGTAFSRAVAQDVTGRCIGEVFPADYRDEVFERWNAVVEHGGPSWGSGEMWAKERDFLRWQGVALPLHSDNREVNQLLGAAVFDRKTTAAEVEEGSNSVLVP
jgi:hypothetical protein